MTAHSIPFVLTSPERSKARTRRGGWTWGPAEIAKLRVLSLGAGVQSSTLVCMMVAGELSWVDAILFADTGDESSATLNHLSWLEREVKRATNGRVEVHRVGRGEKLSDRIKARAAGGRSAGQGRFVSAPFFTDGGKKGRGGQGRRQCTREFKIEPIEKKQRELLGYKPRQRIPPLSCEVWIGISTDEIVRAGAAFSAWVVHRYPLLELRMSRVDCERWLIANGFPVPPKSACVFCPYRSNREWRWLRDNNPEGWTQAVEIDRLIRDTPGMRAKEFLHRDRIAIGEVDLSTDDDHGQGMLMVCEAGCGL